MCMDLRLVVGFGLLGFAEYPGFSSFWCLGCGFSFQLDFGCFGVDVIVF